MHGDKPWLYCPGPDTSLVPPPLPPGLLPDVKPADFNNYKRAYAAKLARFEAMRQSGVTCRIDSEDLAPGEPHHVACRRYFGIMLRAELDCLKDVAL